MTFLYQMLALWSCRLIALAVSDETFSPNANGVGAINAVPTFAPTPLALGLNVKDSHSWAGGWPGSCRF